MIRDTNRRAARGAVLRTGRMAEAAGHSEGSYLASVSNSRPTEYRIFFNHLSEGLMSVRPVVQNPRAADHLATKKE